MSGQAVSPHSSDGVDPEGAALDDLALAQLEFSDEGTAGRIGPEIGSIGPAEGSDVAARAVGIVESELGRACVDAWGSWNRGLASNSVAPFHGLCSAGQKQL